MWDSCWVPGTMLETYVVLISIHSECCIVLVLEMRKQELQELVRGQSVT